MKPFKKCASCNIKLVEGDAPFERPRLYYGVCPKCHFSEEIIIDKDTGFSTRIWFPKELR